jgi:hypothetical protein
LETDLGQHRPDVLPALRDCLSLAKSGNQESKTADSESWNEEQQQISTFTNVASQLKQVLENVQMPQQKPNALVSDNASSPQVFPALVTKSSPDRDHPRFNFQLPISYPISSFISYKGESIFAQSLLQACFRNGYQLLTNASAKLDDIKQVFGSLLTKADRHMMVIFLGHSISSFDTHPPPVFHNDAVFHNYGEMRHKEILQYYSQDPWEFSDSMPLEQEMIDRYAVQKMLRERGVAIDDDISSFPIQSPFGSYIFDVRCFIACMVPVLCFNLVLRIYSSITTSNLCRKWEYRIPAAQV